MATKFEIPPDATLPQILEAIGNTQKLINNVDKDLDNLLTERTELDAKVLHIRSLKPEVALINEQAKNVQNKAVKASKDAQGIAKQVRILDRAQSRVAEALVRVRLIIELKNGIKSVEEALLSEDFESAAAVTHSLLRTPQEIDLKEVDALSFSLLQELEQRLCEKVLEKCNKAESENRTSDLLRFSKLLPKFDKCTKGLELYCLTLKADLVRCLDKLGIASNPSHPVAGERATGVEELDAMLRVFFDTVAKHRAEVAERFGKECQVTLITELEKVADVEVVSLLERWGRSRKINKTVELVLRASKSRHQAGGEEKGPVPPTPLELDVIIEEMAYVCREIEALTATMGQVKMASQVDLDAQTPKPTKLKNALQDIINKYITLERQYMTDSIAWAVKRDEVEGITSSIIADLFLILDKSSGRAFETYDMNAACAMVNNIGIMIGEHVARLNRALSKHHDMFLAFKQKVMQSPADEVMNVLILLNNADKTYDNLAALKRMIKGRIDDPDMGASGRDKLKISELMSGFDAHRKDLVKLLELGFDKLVEANAPRLVDQCLEELKECNFNISDDMYDESSDYDPFAETLTVAVTSFLESQVALLTPGNQDRLLIAILRLFLKRFEKVILGHLRFTFWGGMQLDKNVRYLSGVFANLCNVSIRAEFSRISKLTALLQLEKASEIQDWKDTCDDLSILRAIKLRTDLGGSHILKQLSH